MKAILRIFKYARRRIIALSLENARLVYAEANLEKGATLLHKVSKQLPV